MLSRQRLLLSSTAALLLLPLVAGAQPVSEFVGEWTGNVPGVGDARLIITAIRQNGQVDGRMEFSPRGLVTSFGDNAEPSKGTNYGLVSGLSLRIQTPLGGIYNLRREGHRLVGNYVRGTTYNVSVLFEKTG